MPRFIVLISGLRSLLDLQRIPSFGTLTIAEIEDALATHGLHMAAGDDPDRGPTLAEEFRTVLEQRDQLLALIGRITNTVGTYGHCLDGDRVEPRAHEATDRALTQPHPPLTSAKPLGRGRLGMLIGQASHMTKAQLKRWQPRPS